jgi:8-oxo-dGTP pyrophosphatase MutT (NUDIX family)
MDDNLLAEALASEVNPEARPAATLVLFRARPSGPDELLVVERSSVMAFAGGAIVFPGGRVDVDDLIIASQPDRLISGSDLPPAEAAARIAAIRETLEESGIAIGFAAPPSDDWIAAVRPRLHAHEPFSAMIGDHRLDLDALVPFARWCPKHREARVFDTRFYLAKAPDDAPDPKVDETENVRSFWASAQDLLKAADAETVHVIYPTRRNLERLAQFDSFDATAAHARATPVDPISPHMEDRADGKHLCIPEGLGYPITSELLAAAKTAFAKF